MHSIAYARDNDVERRHDAWRLTHTLPALAGATFEHPSTSCRHPPSARSSPAQWRVIDQTVGPDALLVATEYPEGSNSPILLYNARRQGWSFDGRSLSPHLLDYLLSRGGDIYFATTIWAEVEEPKPDVVAYLRRHRLVPLEGAPPNTRLIRPPVAGTSRRRSCEAVGCGHGGSKIRPPHEPSRHPTYRHHDQAPDRRHVRHRVPAMALRTAAAASFAATVNGGSFNPSVIPVRTKPGFTRTVRSPSVVRRR